MCICVYKCVCMCVCLCVCCAQSYLTLCDPTDCSLPGSSVHGILQTRILEQVSVPISRGSSQTRDQTQVSCFAGRLSSEPPGKPFSEGPFRQKIKGLAPDQRVWGPGRTARLYTGVPLERGRHCVHPHLQLIQAEFTVLPAGALAIGQDPTAAHHDGAWESRHFG